MKKILAITACLLAVSACNNRQANLDHQQYFAQYYGNDYMNCMSWATQQTIFVQGLKNREEARDRTLYSCMEQMGYNEFQIN